MVALGKVYRGRMVDVVASNDKLRDRARRIVQELCRVDEKTAREAFRLAGHKIPIGYKFLVRTALPTLALTKTGESK